MLFAGRTDMGRDPLTVIEIERKDGVTIFRLIGRLEGQHPCACRNSLSGVVGGRSGCPLDRRNAGERRLAVRVAAFLFCPRVLIRELAQERANVHDVKRSDDGNYL